MTPKQKCIEEMIVVGTKMANVCFNMIQAFDVPPMHHNAQIMDSLYRQWDSSMREYRKLTKKAT